MRTNLVPALVVPALAEAPICQETPLPLAPQYKAERRPPVQNRVRLCLIALLWLPLLLLAGNLFAETLARQDFEASPPDTWNYTAAPEGMNRLVWWGRSDQPMGGANAQSGSWYWASWDLDNTEHTLTFESVALPTGYIHSLSFWYYTNGLDPATDYSKYCVEYDTGTQWTNWIPLAPDTDAWTQVLLDVPPYASTLRLKLAASYDGFAKYAHWDNFAITTTPAPPQAPLIYNTSVAQRTDGSKLVDIHYDIFDANNDPCTVSLLLSSDNGATFAEFPNPANLSGDLGDNITNGIEKHIIWNAGADGIAYDASQYKIRIWAEDNNTIPDEFVYVPGGTFTMGNTLGGGNSNELPLHEVTLSSYLIGKYEVTQAEYSQYMQPGSNWTSNYGLGPDYPAYYVSWYAILKYCNLRSMAEGLTPVYTISGSTNPANWGSVPTSNNATWNAAICNWSANGYRLPTEAEWEYAARGGAVTPDYIYSGSNDINTVAWYSGNSGSTTHPVGMLGPNGLSTYDMSGNVWEWCWDWYGDYTSQSQINPTGPGSGSYRLLRGGSWDLTATYCRVSYRYAGGPYHGYDVSGFRLCRAIN